MRPHILENSDLRSMSPRGNRQKKMRYQNAQKYNIIDDFVKSLIGTVLKIRQALSAD